MKGNEKTIFAAVALGVLALAFYMLVLSPKRAEVSELDEEISSLQSQVSQQEQVIAFGRQARKDFPRDYGRLVVLGKAVPEQADTASLLVQLNSIAGSTGVQFRGIALSEGATGEGTSSTAAAPAPATPPPGTAPAEGSEASASTEGSEASTTTTTAAPATPAPATEAAAASLPIGAVVGTAGLPTLPYDLSFRGGYFAIADYMGGLDDLVGFADGRVQVDGRLVTVDGFALQGGAPGSSPVLDANFVLTSYVTPSTEGLTGGATPGGPAPATGAPQATPASQTVAP